MHQDNSIFVTGATGRQGSAVVEALIGNGFKVIGLTRDPLSKAARKIELMGATVVKGNLDNVNTYKEYLRYVQGICCILTYENGVAKEIKQGIQLVDLAKENNIQHFVYSSVIGCDLDTGIPHWESKARIEDHIKKAGLPYTIIRPASLLDNFLLPQVKSRILKGNLPSPVNKNVLQQFISCKDLGAIVATVFKEPGKYLGRTFNIAADEMYMEQLAAAFSDEMQKPVKFQKMPGLITRLVMGKNLYKMFRWINEHDAVFIKDLPAFRREFPFLGNNQAWIKANFSPAS